MIQAGRLPPTPPWKRTCSGHWSGWIRCRGCWPQRGRVRLGKQEGRLRVGNLDARRDFTDVRDIARAYLLAVAKGRPGEVYNLGSGSAPRLRDVLARLLTMTRAKVALEVD